MSYYLNNLLSSFFVGIVSRVLNIPVVFASSAAVYNRTNPYAKSKLIEDLETRYGGELI
jgi:UDP-glucose 4-epimerase